MSDSVNVGLWLTFYGNEKTVSLFRYYLPEKVLFHFLLSFPHVILTLGARKPISHPNTLMKPFTRFCFAFSRTEGSEHSPTRLCQLAPFWKELGLTTSERNTEQNKREMRSGRMG